MRVSMLGAEPSDAAVTEAEIAYAEREARKARLLDFGKAGLGMVKDTLVGVYGNKSGTPKTTPEPTFFEKNKQIIIAGVVIAGVVLVAGVMKKRKRSNPRRRRASRRRR